MKKRPTEKEIEVYKLLSPYFEDLTIKEAAKRLNVSKRAIYQHLDSLRAKCPDSYDFIAIDYKTMIYNQTKTLEYLYNRCKLFAKNHNLTFDLSKDDFYTLITGCCFMCGKLPENIGRNSEDDSSFSYNKYWHTDMRKIINFINTLPICNRCHSNMLKHRLIKQNSFVIWKDIWKERKELERITEV